MSQPSDVNPQADASTKLAAERTRLAYGRTLLGWIRTSVALITFGFSIYQFFRMTRKELIETEHLIGPREFGMMMIVVGLISLVIATFAHRGAMRRLKTEYPDLQDSPEPLLAFMVAALGILGLLVAVLRQ